MRGWRWSFVSTRHEHTHTNIRNLLLISSTIFWGRFSIRTKATSSRECLLFTFKTFALCIWLRRSLYSSRGRFSLPARGTVFHCTWKMIKIKVQLTKTYLNSYKTNRIKTLMTHSVTAATSLVDRLNTVRSKCYVDNKTWSLFATFTII